MIQHKLVYTFHASPPALRLLVPSAANAGTLFFRFMGLVLARKTVSCARGFDCVAAAAGHQTSHVFVTGLLIRHDRLISFANP